ncbi:MAG: hypothetical protein CMJ58_12995 [Planctomycetaceae bacterium]|nr:hypothetical protein [Planctomycetaceae bacterium]
MELTIRFASARRPNIAANECKRILSRSMTRFRQRLRQVLLYIEDVNGPRGGVDVHCRCVLHLEKMPPVVIEDQDANAKSLIHRVANRASHALSRKADRKQKARRRARFSSRLPGQDQDQDSSP